MRNIALCFPFSSARTACMPQPEHRRYFMDKKLSANGVMVVMGFNNDKIYVRNFQQQGFDTIYAINQMTER